MSDYKFFINYRREDTKAEALRLFEALESEFGEGKVFLDFKMPVGVKWDEYIGKANKRAQIVIAMIGSQWLMLQKEESTNFISNLFKKKKPRILIEGDFLRNEIITAKKRNQIVFPLLIDLLKFEDLPEYSKYQKRLNKFQSEYFEHQGFSIRNERWDDDLSHFIEKLKENKEIQDEVNTLDLAKSETYEPSTLHVKEFAEHSDKKRLWPWLLLLLLIPLLWWLLGRGCGAAEKVVETTAAATEVVRDTASDVIESVVDEVEEVVEEVKEVVKEEPKYEPPTRKGNKALGF